MSTKTTGSEEDGLEGEVALGAGGGSWAAADFFTSATPRLRPVARFFRMRKRVKLARPASRPPRSVDDEPPHVAGHAGPVGGAVGPGVAGSELGAEEEEEQRHEEAPGEEAAREVQGAELGTDDVADAEVGRLTPGPGRWWPPRRESWPRRLQAEADEALLDPPHREVELVRGAKTPESRGA